MTEASFPEFTDEDLGQIIVLAIAPVVSLALPGFFFRTNWLAWTLGGTLAGVCVFALALGLGYKFGFVDGRKAAGFSANNNQEVGEASSRLERFETALAEVELYAYEKSERLIPDGYTGLGPMDYDEWQQWKRKGFERTGNLWFNYPGGLPPQPNDDPKERDSAELQ